MSAPKSPYRQLQAQAKARGIPANQSAGILEELLAEEEAGGEGFSGSVAGSNEPSNPRPKMAAPAKALRKLSWICEAVYYDDFRGPTKQTPEAFATFDHVETSTQAAIYQWADITNDPETLIVAFRGTSDEKDVATDLDNNIVQAWPGANVEAHQGFVDTAGLVYAWAAEFVPPGTSHIYVTGHSLGGAAAHVYARHLLAAHPNLKVTLVTFGSPETFSKTEYTTVNLKKHTDRLHHMRVVNDRDLVARASLTNPGLKHHVKATHLTYSTKQWFYTTFKQISWSTVPVLVASYVPLLDAGFDHLMAAYGAHDLDKVQADPVPATEGEKRPLGWD